MKPLLLNTNFKLFLYRKYSRNEALILIKMCVSRLRIKTYTNLWELGHYMTSIKINGKLFNFYMVATFPSLRFFHTESNQLVCQIVFLKREHKTKHTRTASGGKYFDLVHFQNFFLKFLEDISPFLWGRWWLLMTSALGFKATVEPLFLSFLICVQWTPQIHLWCDTCYRLDGQHGGRAFLVHTLAYANASPTSRTNLKK